MAGLGLEPAFDPGKFDDASTWPLNVGMCLEVHSQEERWISMASPQAVPE